MTLPLTLPIEGLEDGPVKDCMEIIRQWAEDAALDIETAVAVDTAAAVSGGSDPLTAAGIKVAVLEGTVPATTTGLIASPGTDVVAVMGISQRNGGGESVMGTTAETRILYFQTLFISSPADSFFVQNDTAATLSYKITVFYRG